MIKRQYRSNQGRSPEQECETQKLIFVATIILIILTIYLILS